MRFEFKIEILNADYVDDLVISLARQGFAPYITDEGDVCITVSDDDLHEVKYE